MTTDGTTDTTTTPAQPPRPGPGAGPKDDAHVTVRGLTLAFDRRVVIERADFAVRRGEIFVIMGASGSGKTTLLRALIGLKEPAAGEILLGGESLTQRSPVEREYLLRRLGVLFQSGGLFGALTLAENVGLPLGEFTALRPAEIRAVAEYKLALVGLRGFEDYRPEEVSVGMQKRAGIARAMALDPEILLLDEPSADLDPITGRRLDDLILELRDSLGATVVVVSHDLASIFTIADRCLFVDGERRAVLEPAPPRELARASDPRVREFLTRGGMRRDVADGSGTNAADGMNG